MKDVEKIILKMRVSFETIVEISPEEGFADFPDNVLEMVDYINEVRVNAETGDYIEDIHRAEAREEYELVDIQVVEKD